MMPPRKKHLKKCLVSIDVAAAGQKGGEARAANLTPEERSEAARKAAQARWAGKKAKEK